MHKPKETVLKDNSNDGLFYGLQLSIGFSINEEKNILLIDGISHLFVMDLKDSIENIMNNI